MLTRTKATDDYRLLTANDLFLYLLLVVFNRCTYEGMISYDDHDRNITLYQI